MSMEIEGCVGRPQRPEDYYMQPPPDRDLGEAASPKELFAVVLMVPIMLYALKLMFEPRED